MPQPQRHRERTSGGGKRVPSARPLALDALGAGAPAVVALMPAAWGRVLGGGGAVPAFLSAFAPRRGSGGADGGGSRAPKSGDSLVAEVREAPPAVARGSRAPKRRDGKHESFDQKEKRSRKQRNECDWNQEEKRILRQTTDGYSLGY